MKRFKRLTALLLAMLILFSLTAGCADDNNASDTNNTAPTTEGLPTAEVTEDPVESLYPLSEETIDLSLWCVLYTANIYGRDEYDDFSVVQYMEDLTNVHIEFEYTSTDKYVEQLSIMASANSMTDMFVNGKYYPGGAAQGIDDENVLDLAPYLEEYAPNYYDRFKSLGTEKNAAILDGGAIPCIYNIKESGANPWGLYIRQDWLDDLGLNTPVTYDDFTDVLTAFKVAYDPSSPYALTQALQLGTSFAAGFGTVGYETGGRGSSFHPFLYQVDDVVYSSFTQDGYRQYIELMNRWYDAGLISSDFMSLTESPFHPTRGELVTTNNTGLFYTVTGIAGSYAAMAEDESFRVLGVASAVQEEGDVLHFTEWASLNTNTSISVSGSCAYPEIAVQWIDYWFSYEGAMLNNFGIEGEAYNLEGGKVVLTELVTANEWDVDAQTALPSFNAQGKFCPAYQLEMYDTYFYGDDQILTVEAWARDDNANVLPQLTLSGTDLETYNAAVTEIETYVKENVAKFITGIRSLDQWDDYVAQINSMGMEECIAIYQKAYNAYLALG